MGNISVTLAQADQVFTGGAQHITAHANMGLRMLVGSPIVSTKLAPVSVGNTNYTYCLTKRIPLNTVAIKLIFLSGSDTNCINTKASIGFVTNPTGGTTNPYTPTSLTPLTFASASTVTIPASTSGANTADAVLNFVSSDVLPVTPAARTDDLTSLALHVRMYVPTAGNTDGKIPAYVIGTLANGFSADLGVYGGYFSGDQTATVSPGGFTAAGSALPPCLIICYTTSNIKTICDVGDSTMQGYLGTDYNAGALAVSIYGLQAQGGKFERLSMARESGTTPGYYQNFSNILTYTKPYAAVFCPTSTNNSHNYDATAVNDCKYYCSIFTDLCKQNNVMPILRTPNPKNGLNSTQEGFRRSMVTLIKAFCTENSVKLIDADSIYTDYSTNTGGYLPAYNNDGTHTNAAGYAAEATLYTALLPTI
jgi:hypothetical protein